MKIGRENHGTWRKPAWMEDVDVAYERILSGIKPCRFQIQFHIYLHKGMKIFSEKCIVLIENQWPVLNKSFIIALGCK
jgi:hypothetical protein